MNNNRELKEFVLAELIGSKWTLAILLKHLAAGPLDRAALAYDLRNIEPANKPSSAMANVMAIVGQYLEGMAQRVEDGAEFDAAWREAGETGSAGEPCSP